MTSTMAKHTDEGTTNGVKLLGEVIVPGASQLIDGNIRAGGAHLLGAIASIGLLGAGGAGLLVSMLIRGNSYTTSTINKPLHRALFGDRKSNETAATA